MKQSARSLRFLAFMLSLFGLLALSAGVAFGQALDGNVVGTIIDAQGAVVVGADVTATNIATNVVAIGKTGGSGEYRFDHLLPGIYKISAKMTGFKSISEQVDVELNKTTTRNLTMSPGATSETVEVSGTPPTIDTTTSQLQTTYESQVLQDLPTASSGGSQGGGVLNAALLQAGVGSTGGLGAGSGPSVGGTRPRENNFTIEGADNNDKGVTGPLVYIPNDAVANFTVITNQFSPEFGHSAGGQFNQVIQSGTNTIHGTAYEYFRNRNLNAIDYTTAIQDRGLGITPTNSRFDNNRFGFQIGGPIKKNKLFYFVNFEKNPVGQAASPSSAACGPTAGGWATIAGLGSVLANNVTGFSKYDTAPSQAAVGANNPCQGNGAATVIVNDYSSGTPVANVIPIGVVPIIAPNYINGTFLTTSGDWDISDKDQFRIRYVYNRVSSIDTGAELPAFYTTLKTPVHLATLGEYHTFSPNIVNEARVSFTRTGNDFTVPGGVFPGLDAFPNLTIDELGQINVGPDPSAPQYATQNTYQITDNLSWNVGKHSFKFGVDLRKQIDPQKFIQRSRGDYIYGDYTGISGDGASGLDAFVNDFLPTTASRSFGSVGYSGDDKMYGWYVNDIWKITRNLSLNLGLRYEYLSIPAGWEQQALNKVADDPGLITFNAPAAPKKDFMPRIGFAYSPGTSGNTSIRGGYSIGYDVLYDNIGTLERPPEIGATISCPKAGICNGTDNTPGFLAGGGIPPQNLSGITQLSQAQARASTSAWLPEHVQYPYVESWNLGVQHVFGPYTAEVRYLGSRGVHLDLQTRLNAVSIVTKTNSLPTYLQAPSQGQLDALTVNLNSPGNGIANQAGCAYFPASPCVIDTPYLNAGFTTFITGYVPWGKSTYHGLQSQLQRRFTNGLQFLAAWTYSHEIDNSTADFFSTVISPRRAQDFRNYGAEKANGLLDHAHRLSFQLTYDVPWFKHDSSWIKKNVLGNYAFIPVYTWESGQWGTVQSGDDANLNFDAAPDRAILNPAGQKNVGSDITPLCNTGSTGPDCNGANGSYIVAYLAKNPNARYITAGPGALANTSRGNVQTPAINNFDVSAVKHLKFGERFGIDFLAQSFNMFNHPQFVTGSVNDVLSFSNTSSRANFEPSSGSFLNPKLNFPSNARTMQLALKFSF